MVRDNVLFELGLFIGAIGKDRSFIIKPRDVKLHLPTDLLGVNQTDYESNRSDGDLISATNRACLLLKQEATKKGIIDSIITTSKKRIRANPESYELCEIDLKFLTVCLSSHTNNPGGLPFDSICYELQNSFDEAGLRISAIQLERTGYVEKTIETDAQNDYDYYAYKITEDGISVLLNKEPDFKKPTKPPAAADDDIPF